MVFRFKYLIRQFLIPFICVYILLHLIYSTARIFQVDTKRISYENLKNGPLLLKPGKHFKNRGNLIEAVGFGRLSFFDGPNKKKKRNRKEKILRNSDGFLLNRDQHTPKLDNQTVKIIVEEAQNLLNSFNETTQEFIYFTFINDAYKKLTLNWICNTALMKKVHHRVFIVTIENSTCQKIEKHWNNSIKCASLNINNFDDSYAWGGQKYIGLLTIRANILLALTQADIPYVLFETDAIWFKDPYLLFKNWMNSYEDSDIIVPIKGYDGGRWDTLSFDPMMVFPNNRSKYFLEEMVTSLNNDSKLYDQDLMNEFCAKQLNGLVCRSFEYKDVADGKWFKMSKEQRLEMKPYIVNNNFYSGTGNKETRQSLNGYWFLGVRDNRCLLSKVEKFMKNSENGL